MKRWLAAGCVALLLLLALVWWPGADEPVDSPERNAADANPSAASIAIGQSPRKLDVSTEELTSPASGAIDNSETLSAGVPPASVATNLRPKCLRKEDKKPDEFELNAALRNEGPGGGSSTLSKEACFAAVGEIKRSRWMFDKTPTQTVAYTPRPDIHWLGVAVQETVLHELCSGDRPFDAALTRNIELYFVTAEATTKVLIGPYWVSEGTIQSPLTEEQYLHITKTLSVRRRDVIGPGGNMSSEIFDRRLKERFHNLATAEAEAQEQRDAELRHARGGLPADCEA